MNYYLLILLLTLSVPVYAQLNAAQLPPSGRRTADFVPPGWRMEQRLGGDLTLDERPDSVLMLVENPLLPPGAVPLSYQRALVVLRTEADGTLHRVGVGPAALFCTRCFDGEIREENRVPVLRIERGRLDVTHTFGQRYLIEQTQHYRVVGEGQRVLLLADTYNVTNSASGCQMHVLTLFREQRQRIYKSCPVSGQQSGKRERLLPTLYLEEVNVTDDIPSWLPADLP